MCLPLSSFFLTSTENDEERGKSNDDDDDDDVDVDDDDDDDDVDVDDDDDDDVDDDDDEPIVPADRDAQVPRTEVAALLAGTEHEWREYFQLYYDGGVIKKDEKTNIDVVGEQQIPPGDGAECALMKLGIFPCSESRGVYEGNPTTRAIQREVGLSLGGDVMKKDQKLYVLWCDMCKISARETNASINERKIGPILGQNVSLQDEFFRRFSASLRILISNEAYARVNQYPVIGIAGDQVEKNAFEKWLERGSLRIEKMIYEADPFQVLLVAIKMLDDDGNKYEQLVVFIAGGEHPSAHLRQVKESVAKFKILCSLEAAAIRYARFDANGKTFDEFLDASVKQRLEVRKKRKEKFLELFRGSPHRDLVSVVGNDDKLSRYKEDFVHLRHVELEHEEVAENFQSFLKENDSEFVLKGLKLVSFVKALGRSESTESFSSILIAWKRKLLPSAHHAQRSNSCYAALSKNGKKHLAILKNAKASNVFEEGTFRKASGTDSFHSALSTNTSLRRRLKRRR